jgi:hypothetical protein
MMREYVLDPSRMWHAYRRRVVRAHAFGVPGFLFLVIVPLVNEEVREGFALFGAIAAVLYVIGLFRYASAIRDEWRKTQIRLDDDEIRLIDERGVEYVVARADVESVRAERDGSLFVSGRCGGLRVPCDLDCFPAVRDVLASWRPVRPYDAREWLAVLRHAWRPLAGYLLFFASLTTFLAARDARIVSLAGALVLAYMAGTVAAFVQMNLRIPAETRRWRDHTGGAIVIAVLVICVVHRLWQVAHTRS